MRPHLIYIALTSTALMISGCSSARSISNPFRGSTGVASSANDFNEYDRDPPAPRQSSRIASEPSPVPPARGISLSRIIDATPAGFRRAIGCGDSCTGDAQAAAACGSDTCGTEGCASQTDVVCRHRWRLCDFRLFKFKRPSCLQKLCGGGCTDETSCTGTAGCTDQPANTCAAPSTYCPGQAASPSSRDCYSEDRPRIAPPLGERQHEYDDRPQAIETPMQNDSSPNAVPDAPGMVPDIPVDPIGQTRSAQPGTWDAQPLYGLVDDMGRVQKRVIHLEPPAWRSYSLSAPQASSSHNQLFPTATRLKTPSGINDLSVASNINIQPLIRVQEPITTDSL